MASWREHSRAVVAAVLKETEGQTQTQIKVALYHAYPFGERAMHPYKIWLNEIKRQRFPAPAKCREQPAADPCQLSIFEEEKS